jgi:hypothetical protein
MPLRLLYYTFAGSEEGQHSVRHRGHWKNFLTGMAILPGYLGGPAPACMPPNQDGIFNCLKLASLVFLIYLTCL